MSANVPKNHHFVPQFILRNFSEDGVMLNIYDLETKEIQRKNLEYQFRKRNMYKNPELEDVMYVEKKFAELENKASVILKKFVNDRIGYSDHSEGNIASIVAIKLNDWVITSSPYFTPRAFNPIFIAAVPDETH